MKIKIGNKVYDPKDTPVMVILTDEDKFNISNMDPDATRYCAFPDDMIQEKVEKWMDEKYSDAMKSGFFESRNARLLLLFLWACAMCGRLMASASDGNLEAVLGWTSALALVVFFVWPKSSQ